MANYGPETFSLRDGRTVLLRSCTARDALQFGAFKERIASESTHTLQYVGQPAPFPEKVAAHWETARTSKDSLFVGAFDGETMVGQIAVFSEIPNHPWVRHVGAFGMMVFASYWGQGIGRRLLAIADEMAPRLGFSRLEAKVRVKNERGVRLYTSAGYSIEGTLRNAAFIDGEFHDEYCIAKILTAAPAPK